LSNNMLDSLAARCEFVQTPHVVATVERAWKLSKR
jgi:hypothetical protein